MNGGDGEVATTPAGPPPPLDWKFSQVFNERTAGEEVQEGVNQGVTGLPLKGWPLTGIDQLRPGLGSQVQKPNLQTQNQFLLASQQQALAPPQAQGNLGSQPNYGFSGLQRGSLSAKDSQHTRNDGSICSPVQSNSPKGLVEGYLLRATQRSDIFAHILIWHLQNSSFQALLPVVRQRLIDGFSPKALDLFNREFDFFDKVTSISGVLFSLPKEERRAGIRRELVKIEVKGEDLYLAIFWVIHSFGPMNLMCTRLELRFWS